MNIENVVEQAYSNMEQKKFFEMKQRILRKMIHQSFDEEEIEYIEHLARCTQLMQIVSECAEAYQALRKDDYKNFCFESADVVIATATLAGENNIPLDDYIDEKLKINEKRQEKHGNKF